jgi:hypothetical protein
VVGVLDTSVWQRDYLPKISHPEKIRKLYLSDHPAMRSGSSDQWIEHGRIVSTLAKLITDPEMFKVHVLSNYDFS